MLTTSLLALALSTTPTTDLPARDLGFRDGGWQTTDPKARIEMLGGREALRLTTAMSFRRDIELQDGTIEFDLWSTGERAFAYIHFRMQSEGESEAIYFRLHKSKLPDAIQYDPFHQRVGNWQLFHGPDSTAAAEIPTGQWKHVRLVLSGEKAALFYGDAKEPVLTVPKLARGGKGGFIALRSFLGANITGNVEPPSSFANVVVRPGVVDYDFSKVVEKAQPALPGLVQEYRFSRAFAPADGPVLGWPATVGEPQSWPVVKALPSGLVVIGKHVDIPAGMKRYGAVASFRVRAAEGGVKRLRLGFSDEASVFLNGQIVYSGDQRYVFNFPRQEGLIHLDQASVYMPLKQGDNTIQIAVSEVFGGWGLMAQFVEPTGLVLEP